jgi:hypothetical protein
MFMRKPSVAYQVCCAIARQRAAASQNGKRRSITSQYLCRQNLFLRDDLTLELIDLQGLDFQYKFDCRLQNIARCSPNVLPLERPRLCFGGGSKSFGQQHRKSW